MNLSFLHDIFLLAAGLATGVVFALLFWLYNRIATMNKPPQPAQPNPNLTEMSILFQTMRDIVREQKSMARDFNRGMDKKIEVVREAVRQIVAGHEQLVRMQNDFRRQVEQAQTQPTAAPQPAPEPAPVVEDFPLLHAIAMPEEAELTEEWQGYEGPAEPEAIEDPEQPHDPELAREAFRALLNIEDPREVPAPVVEAKPFNGNGNGNGAANGNGNGAMRSRVYKYHDAGMSISDIAQELGVGKGEVRLMLSLRNK